ncbi:MAG: MarR family transcriptional regulator [Thermomicrobiales bacterium]|nr:MarR family transcriptional regulator [Thermomicrobiales bacterium]
MAATTSAKSSGSTRAADAERIAQAAESLFWLPPRFTRWAMARVPQQASAGELSLQQLTVLNLVRTEGVTLAELARRTMVAPTVITGIVDRLERQGLIRREADPRDRRVNRLVLTDAGNEVSVAVEKSLVAEVAAQMTDYTESELADLARGLELLERLTGRLSGARQTRSSAG